MVVGCHTCLPPPTAATRHPKFVDAYAHVVVDLPVEPDVATAAAAADTDNRV